MEAQELYTTPLFSDSALKLYLRFEDNVTDSSPAGNNGTNISLPYSTSAGKFNKGGDFDSDAGITFGNPADFRTQTFTINFWLMRRPDASRISFIWARCPNTDSYAELGLFFFNDDKLKCCIDNNGGSGEQIQIGTLTRSSFADGDMVTFVGNYPTMKCFINGVESGTATFSTLNFTQNVNSPTQAIGQDGAGDRYHCPSMRMDDFAFFNRVLTDTEISNLYNGFPVSTNGAFILGMI